MNDNIISILTKTLAFLILLLLIPVGYGFINPSILAILVVINQIGMTIIVRKFKPLAIFFLFTFPYIYVTFAHFVNGSMPLTLGYTQFDNENYYTNVLVIQSLFLSVLALKIPIIKNPFVLRDLLVIKNSPSIFYGTLTFMILITIFGRSGTSIFESGGYGSANAKIHLGGGLAIFEYFLVLLPIAYVYSNRNKTKLRLLLIVAISFCAKGLLFGGRIETLQCLLMIYILYLDKTDLKLRRVIFAGIFPVLFFIVFGFIRSNPNIKLTELGNLLTNTYKYFFYTIFGNHIEVYYSSTRLYGFVQEGILSFQERLSSFLLNIVAIVVPYSKLPDIANLAAFKKDIYPAGGGSLISVFFYTFLSYPGVILISIFIGRIVKSLLHTSNMYLILYAIMVFSTYPRWFAYSPNVLYKLSFYIIPMYLLINKFLSKKINKKQ